MVQHLTDEQVEARGHLLQKMANDYWHQRPYLKRNEAYEKFGAIVLRDHKLQRYINAMVASTTKGE
jgi:hypothetical protein